MKVNSTSIWKLCARNKKRPFACSVDCEVKEKYLHQQVAIFRQRFAQFSSKIGYMIENSVNKSGVKLDELENM